MELTAYIRIFRRWLWLIAIAAIVMGSITFVIARSRPVEYQASVTIQVGSAFQVTNPNVAQLTSAEQLAQTYVVLLKTYPVLSATLEKLQLSFSTDDLEKMFQARIVPNTSLITVTVTYNDPIVVTDIANELARELIANSPTTLTKDQQAQIATLRTEIAAAQTELQNARDELKSIETQLQTATGTDRTALTSRRTELVTQISSSQSSMAQLSSTLATLEQQGNTNTLDIVEQARVPDAPVSIPVIPITLVAAVLGAVIAGVAAVFIEYLNDTIRAPMEIQPLLGVPAIGSVRPFGNKATYDDKLVAWTQPRSTISEEYRAIRVNLMYREKGGVDRNHRVYIVTSPNPGEGKSVTAANLAVTFAITGMRVLLVDADLRRPVQHRLFNLPNTLGLANFLSSAQINRELAPGKAPTEVTTNRYALRDYLTTTVDAVRRGESARGIAVQEEPSNGNTPLLHSTKVSLGHIIQKSSVTGLDVISSGPSPLNPTELLGTAQMQELIEWLSHNEEYDVVIFDTPPVLAVSDSNVLANVSEADVILVVRARQTHRSAALSAVQQLAGLSIPIAGIVVNWLNPRDTDAGYYGYYYGYYGYGASNTPADNGAFSAPLTPGNKKSRE